MINRSNNKVTHVQFPGEDFEREIVDKALQDEVEAQDTRILNLETGKADKTAVNTALAAKANSADMTTALAAKANSSDVNSALALKANQTYVEAQDGRILSLETGKADKTYVDQQDTALSGRITALENAPAPVTEIPAPTATARGGIKADGTDGQVLSMVDGAVAWGDSSDLSWKLIADITATESTTHILVKKDTNGNDFELTEAFFVAVEQPKDDGTTSSWGRLHINYSHAPSFYVAFRAVLSTSKAINSIMLSNYDGLVVANYGHGSSNVGGGHMNTLVPRNAILENGNIGTKKIKSFSINCHAGCTVGSRFRIYGR